MEHSIEISQPLSGSKEKTAEALPQPISNPETYSTRILGFWIYLMSDCILFSILFTTFVILRRGTFGGPSGQELFDLHYTFAQTIVLLTSSFFCGFATLSICKNKKGAAFAWFVAVFLLGATFVVMEGFEFAGYVSKGDSWERSAFLSSFFTLVGTHGLHVSIGLIWMALLMGQIFRFGVNPMTFKRFICFNMFWHFLDFVWIFIFTIVYLMGKVL